MGAARGRKTEYHVACPSLSVGWIGRQPGAGGSISQRFLLGQRAAMEIANRRGFLLNPVSFKLMTVKNRIITNSKRKFFFANRSFHKASL